MTTYDKILKKDCFGHSVVLDPVKGIVRPLMVLRDTQCSSGQFGADGVLYQTGGDTEGTKNTRYGTQHCESHFQSILQSTGIIIQEMHQNTFSTKSFGTHFETANQFRPCPEVGT